MFSRVIATVALVCLTWSPVSAEVVRIEIQSRTDVLSGKSFGDAGAYEKLVGKVYFEIDPANSANTIITDIANAPRNARGRVEFSSDFFLIKPKQIERGNGTVLYEVSNRGGKGMLGFYQQASGNLNPASEADFGDGFLMNRGFTLLWLGWQFDVPKRDGLVRVYPPVATANGKPIVGIVRSEVIVARKAFDASLADREHIAYAVADPNDPTNSLTVRDTIEGPRRLIPRTEWEFARFMSAPSGTAVGGGAAVPDPTRVYLKSGFEPGKIYEVVYRSQNPPVVGVGPAAVRDTIAMLKYGSADAWSIPSGAIKRAVAFGVSQSGRFLRTYLYYGFNEDEGHRKAFDGIMAHVAGAGRGSFNLRFAQPSRDGHPFLNKFYPTDIFPFTDAVETDPETGAKDGLLLRVKPEFMPKVFYTNSSYEYYGRAASLIHTTIDGRGDAPLVSNTRVYMFAGGQHGPGPFPPRRSIGQQLNNPNDYRWIMRSLVVSMDKWIKDGTEPPASRYPLVADKTLVKLEELRFPSLPGVQKPKELHKAYRASYGADFATKGIITLDPPEVNGEFPLLVPQVDRDGNELAGLKMPEVAVPLATYTGWNLFNAESGPTNLLSSMQGSYIPLARTRSERERTKDPRLSIEERYQSRDQYLSQVSTAAAQLVRGGYLLQGDVTAIVEHAGRHWDLVSSSSRETTASRP
jgi:Alpha/beta hydrolase domain